MRASMRVLFAGLLLLAAGLTPASAIEYSPLVLTSPAPMQDLSGSRQVTISWESTLGGDVDYSIVLSSDGKAFDRVIASKLRDVSQYTWEFGDALGFHAWIKVKAFRQGYLLAESVVQVSSLPKSVVVVSKADQKVLHFRDGKLRDVFTCSTALPKYDLDAGTYQVYSREAKHWSRQWEVWMPHSLFFHGGYALHATSMIRQLGRPASHGCIRLHPRDAKKLFDEVSIGTPVIVLPKSKRCSALLHPRRPEGPVDNRQAASGSRSTATSATLPPASRPF